MTCPAEEHEVDEAPRELAAEEYIVSKDDEGNEHITLHYSGYVESERIAKVINMILWWHNAYPESSWEIIINSEGGEMDAGVALYSTLRRFSLRGGGEHHITTRVAGRAASAGAFILMAGDEIIGGMSDFIMIHEPVCSFEEARPSEIRAALAHAEMWQQAMVDICMERCTVDREWFEAQFRGRDWWISMSEAHRIGLVTRVA